LVFKYSEVFQSDNKKIEFKTGMKCAINTGREKLLLKKSIGTTKLKRKNK